jgi:hypothetical protein
MANPAYEIMVGFKLSREQVQKLDGLARSTHRTVSQVLRTLIDQAKPLGRPDIVLNDEGPLDAA